jgi:hypothetical protein
MLAVSTKNGALVEDPETMRRHFGYFCLATIMLEILL